MESFGFWVVAGFLAQMVDGALGMAYGVTCSSLLLAGGLSPAAASAAVHTAEIFTTLASGVSHWTLKNVDKRLLLRLAVPGVVGAVAGALLVSVVPGQVIKPVVSVYLGWLGLRLVRRALDGQRTGARWAKLRRLGLLGGFCDAVGGGGWGPIVSTALLSRDIDPRRAIGSGNAAEFFVTLASSLVFGLTIGVTAWRPVLGLILGGLLAAPLAAWTVKLLPRRALMALVGLLVMLLSLRNLGASFG